MCVWRPRSFPELIVIVAISASLCQPPKILQRYLRFIRVCPASVVLFTDVHTLLAEVAIRIPDVDLHLSLAGDSLDVFSLCVVELRMSDYSSVLWTYVRIVVAMEGMWMV